LSFLVGPQFLPDAFDEVFFDEAFNLVAFLVENAIDAKIKVGDVELEECSESLLELRQAFRGGHQKAGTS
jgi:hypothetical protein